MCSTLHPSANTQLRKLETMHPTAVAIHRILFDAHNPVGVSHLEHAYVEWIQELIIQHPRHYLLWNMMVGYPPGSSSRGSFYGTKNIFHISTPATSWSTSICHSGLHTTCFLQMTFQRNKCPAIWMPLFGILLREQTLRGCNLTLCLSVQLYPICHLAEWVLHILCHSLRHVCHSESHNTRTSTILPHSSLQTEW
jgi:hypothetical protein